MANDGTITFSVWLDAEDTEKELASIKKKIHELEMQLNTQNKVKSGLEEQLQRAGAAADKAKAKLEELRRSGASAAAIKEQEGYVKAYDQDFNRAADALERQNAKIAETTAKIETQKEAYGQLEKEAVKAGHSGSSAAEAVSSRLSRVAERIGAIAASAFVFSMLTRAFNALRDYAGKALQTNEEFTAATARLRASLLTAFQPIYTAALPALTALINVLSAAISMIARFTSLLFGSTAQASAEAAESLYDEANALDKVGGGAGKASKSLASFDEINKLSTSGGGGGGGGGAAGGTKDPDFTNAIKGQMSEIEIYLSGALLGLGAILAFSGASIPLGIALMAVGALGLASAISENWNEMPDNIRKALTRVLLILGGAALTIGAILAFSGANLPLGIGLMVAGAAALGGAAALNWDKIKTALRGPIGEIVAIASGALLALGLILALSGAALPLGIGLIAAGAAGLATTAAVNWNSIVTAIRGPLGGIVAAASAALLALGIIMVCTGVGLPLGIALIAAGAAGLATPVALNWDAIRLKISDAWNKIKIWWKSGPGKVFTLQYWTEKFSVIAEGLKAAVNGALGAAESGINWIIGKLNSISFDVPSWVPAVGGKHFGISIPQVSVPRLAAGAVIPPNREFLAVLGDQRSGTNIETPLDTMVQAFRAALTEEGMGTAHFTIYLDGEKIAENTVRRINRGARASGELSLV